MRYQICNIIEGNCGFIIIVKLDHRGLQKNDLIIVARPSVGKTAFALNIAQNVAARIEEPVAIFSLEMSAAQLVTDGQRRGQSPGK